MHFERLLSASGEKFREAMELYSQSFPLNEQREAASQEKILSCNEYHFDLIFDGELFAGIMLYWDAPEFIYLEHFCIKPELRGHELGSRALKLLSGRGKAVILEIDPPEDGISIRRRGFYLRSGFHENAFFHLHPPYHKGNPGHRLTVMSWPGALSSDDYAAFFSYLSGKVMKDVF